MLVRNDPAQLREGVSLLEMASLITKRTRTAADGDMHEASNKNSDGTHHVMIGETKPTFHGVLSRRTGGDVATKHQTTGDYSGLSSTRRRITG